MDLNLQVLKYWPALQKAIVAALTLCCGVWLAQITWFFLAEAPQVQVEQIQPANSQAKSGVDWASVSSQVANREFFGEVVIEVVEEAPVENVEAPETSLSFTLQAVMALGEGTGFAVISERGSNSEVFGVGDDLFGKAQLSGVFGDRVIIDRRGQLETLRYERVESTALQPVEFEEPVDYNQGDLTNASTFQDAISQANSAVSNGADVQSQVRGVVDYVSRRANENPEAFVQEMGLQPTQGGYQVTRNARQLQMVGLRPGDIVTSVNDIQVGNIQADQTLLNQILQTGGELKIQIRRGSRSFTIYQSIPSF